MNARDAFCQLVTVMAFGDWSPALPDIQKIDVGGTFHTSPEICQLASSISEELPDDILGMLLTEMADQKIRETLGKDRTFATGAVCLLNWLEGRIASYQRRS